MYNAYKKNQKHAENQINVKNIRGQLNLKLNIKLCENIHYTKTKIYKNIKLYSVGGYKVDPPLRKKKVGVVIHRRNSDIFTYTHTYIYI